MNEEKEERMKKYKQGASFFPIFSPLIMIFCFESFPT
jgi:hypothetical protein